MNDIEFEKEEKKIIKEYIEKCGAIDKKYQAFHFEGVLDSCGPGENAEIKLARQEIKRKFEELDRKYNK